MNTESLSPQPKKPKTSTPMSSQSPELDLDSNLTESELRAVLESSPVGIAFVNRKHELVDSSVNLPKLVAHRSFSGSPIKSLNSELALQLRPFIDQVFESGQILQDRDVVTRDPNGSPLYWQTSFTPITDRNGQVSLVACFIEDVTESRRAKESLQSHDKQMDNYLAMLGHELRNPLAAIVNATELLNFVHSDDNELTEVRDVLSRQTACMKTMIDGLLDITRISQGRIPLNSQLLDITNLVREIAGDHRAEAQRLGLELKEDLPKESIWVNADRTRLLQAFTSLLSNALKFTPAGGNVNLKVRATREYVSVTVHDTGIGIDSELLPNIFEPFRQGLQNIDRSQGGLGLGLALTKGLIELHHGTVNAVSFGKDLGAEFKVRLPRVLHKEEATKADPRSAGFRPFKILVVEDNIDAAVLLKRILTKCGQHVELVHNGRDALTAVESHDPDLVLCDIGLPGELDGYEVAKSIRAKPRFGKTPLIAVTGYGLREDIDKALSAGFNRHLTKPVNFSMLKQLLGEFDA